MELLVFGHSGARVIVFPSRCGRFYDYENWGIANALRHKIEHGLLQLICVDSVDAESFYCNWCPPHERIRRHLLYEEYILNEVVPFTHARNGNPALIAHGCSLGAYHAVNISFRHPHLFCKVVALSGRYDLTSEIGSFRNLFEGYYDEDIYFNSPSHFVPNITDPDLLHLLRRLEVILVIGKADAFLGNNILLSQILGEKGIQPTFHVWDDEAHAARYWRKMVIHYL
jgi:esterase/lipase superfamily enzyme